MIAGVTCARTGRRARPAAVAVLFAATLAACSVEPVTRKVTLVPAAALPSGTVSLDADELRVEFEHVEPLLADARHVAWAKSPTDYVHLGAVDDGDTLVFALADLGLDQEDVEAILVTIEDAAVEAPQAPSTVPVLRAGGPGLLGVAGVTDEAVAEATATATLEDARVDFSSTGLPRLPSPLFYGLWARLASDPEADHTSHEQSAGHEEGDAAAGSTAASTVTPLGALDAAGTLIAELDFQVATAEGLILSIETKRGVTSMSPCIVLEGAVALEAGESASDGTSAGPSEGASEGGAEHAH